jgi:hypothetical protein
MGTLSARPFGSLASGMLLRLLLGNPGADFRQRLQSLGGSVQQVLIGSEPAAFTQKNDRRSAKMKISFFLAFLHRPRRKRLNDATDTQRAHLDLQEGSTTRALDNADVTLVAKTRCASRQRDRVNRVQVATAALRDGCLAVDRKVKAVIVAGGQADDEAGAGLEPDRAASEINNIDGTAFDMQLPLRQCGKREYTTLGGCSQMKRVRVNRSRFGLQLTCKKSIERRIGRGRQLRLSGINTVTGNEGGNLMSAYRRSVQYSDEMARPGSLGDSMQEHGSPPRLVQDAELAFSVYPLRSQLSGFPVDKTNFSRRRSHLADYTLATIDPSSPEFREFADLPHVRSINPFAPPASEVALQLGADSLFYRHGDARLFGCYRNGQLVGRAVASIDHRYPDPDVGHFGFFETGPERVCAGMLMGACEEWLRQRGKRRIEGPMNLNMLAGYRLQTAGFDTSPFPGEPRNPRHYADLLGTLGYRDVALWRSWDIGPLALLGLHAIDWLQRAQRQASVARGYRVEALRPDDAAENIRKIHRLVHEIFADNYGFSAIDFAEHIQMQGAAMNDSTNISGAFLYHSSQRDPVGFSFGYYTNQLAILHTFGVTQLHRGSGAADLLFSNGLREMRKHRIRSAIGALAKEGKTKYQRIGRPARTYKIVGKEL